MQYFTPLFQEQYNCSQSISRKDILFHRNRKKIFISKIHNPAAYPNAYVWMSFPSLNIPLMYVTLNSVTLGAYISNAVIGFLQSSDPKWWNVTFVPFFPFSSIFQIRHSTCYLWSSKDVQKKRHQRELSMSVFSIT